MLVNLGLSSVSWLIWLLCQIRGIGCLSLMLQNSMVNSYDMQEYDFECISKIKSILSLIFYSKYEVVSSTYPFRAIIMLICVLHLIIIIKSTVCITNYSLGFSHWTGVGAECVLMHHFCSVSIPVLPRAGTNDETGYPIFWTIYNYNVTGDCA